MSDLVTAGFLPALTVLISHPNEEIANLAVVNIAGDLVIDYGGDAFTSEPIQRSVEQLEAFIWPLSNLCRGLPSPPDPLYRRNWNLSRGAKDQDLQCAKQL